jgi:hypothetical protein
VDCPLTDFGLDLVVIQTVGASLTICAGGQSFADFLNLSRTDNQSTMRQRLICLLAFLTLTSSVLFGQDRPYWKTDYPDSLIINREYSFSFKNDTLLQSARIMAIGDQNLWFYIDTWTKDDELMSGQLHNTYTGTAKLYDVNGVVAISPTTSTDTVMPYKWTYKTPDKIFTITIHTLYDHTVTDITLSTANINSGLMGRKNE